MIKTVHPSNISGRVKAPPSKSMMQRAVAAALLADGISEINNPSCCDDSNAAIKMAVNLGAEISRSENKIIIKGGGKQKSNVLNSEESGLSARMFSAIASLYTKPIEITGNGTLLNRPFFMIEEPLRSLGANCRTNNGFLPLCIEGPVDGGKTIVDGSSGSQFLTGLLMALPKAKNNSEIIVEDLKSKPYIDLTINVLSDFGIEVINDNYERFEIKGNQSFVPANINIEGDWSGSAFLLVAGALGGEVEVAGLNRHSEQADMAILKALKQAGSDIIFSDNSVKVVKKELNAFDFDATHCPDLFPPLAAMAAHCKGESRIKGVSRLKHKESNRAVVMQKEFGKTGIDINLEEDMMLISGGIVKGGMVNANNDHRIAMAAACVAILAKDKIKIVGAECVKKSFPGFFDELALLQIGNINGL